MRRWKPASGQGLAGRQMIGEGLIPVPFGTGRHGGAGSPTHGDQARLDQALRVLGDWLAGDDSSVRLRHSRSVLAETLLAVREGLPDGVLASLPLVRVYRLPEGSEDAWSVDRLVETAARHRVFGSPFREGDGEGVRLADPRQATRELADALGEGVWFVAAWHVAAVTKTPTADADGVGHRRALVLKASPTRNEGVRSRNGWRRA